MAPPNVDELPAAVLRLRVIDQSAAGEARDVSLTRCSGTQLTTDGSALVSPCRGSFVCTRCHRSNQTSRIADPDPRTSTTVILRQSIRRSYMTRPGSVVQPLQIPSRPRAVDRSQRPSAFATHYQNNKPAQPKVCTPPCLTFGM